MVSAWCVACDLHTIAPGPLERVCWRRFGALWGDHKKSRTAPLNAIIIIIIIIVCASILHSKTLNMDIKHKLFNQIFHICPTYRHHWLNFFYYFQWMAFSLAWITKSAQKVTCSLHCLTHFSTNWDGISYSVDAVQVEHPKIIFEWELLHQGK